MKKRHGFVSNSSSSSFVLGKAHMTDEQINKFQNMLDEINDCYEGYVFDTKYYFHGEVSNHNKILPDLIYEMELQEFASFDC